MKPKIDFMGLGFARCGTSSVAKHLSNHPEISMYSLKDTDYFSTMDLSNMYTPKYEKDGIKGYMKILKKDGMDFNKVCGEFGSYYGHDKKAIDRIYKHFPNMKIILCTRNPVERIQSHYSMQKLNNIPEVNKDGNLSYPKNLSFMGFIKEFPHHLEIGRYDKHVEYIRSKFGGRNIIGIDLDDLKENPKGTMNFIYDFLGVDSNFVSPDINKIINPSSIRGINQKTIKSISKSLEMLGATGFPVNSVRPFLNRMYTGLFRPKKVKKIKLTKKEIKYLEGYYED